MSPSVRTAGVLVLLTALAVTARADEPTWAGKTVLLKRDGVTFTRKSREGAIIFQAPLTRISYDVLREEGDWIQVRQSGEEGWLPKADAVLQTDAVSYFTA